MFHKLDEVVAKHREITEELQLPETSANPKRLTELNKQLASMDDIVQKYLEYKKLKDEYDFLREGVKTETDNDMREMMYEEIKELEERMPPFEQELKVLLIPKDPNDDKNVFVEIRGGAGGDEAALFAYDMYRMFTRYAERKKWKVEVMELNEIGVGGLKEVVFLITGQGAYSKLKFESGIHRVQRVPATESQGRVHTSTITVAVLPEIEDVEMVKIDPKDLKIDTYRSGGAGGQHVNMTDSAVRITHLPTNTVVQCQDERSQLKNRDKAMKALVSKLYEAECAKQAAAVAGERKLQVGTGARSEKIRTYNFPQGRVSDHRIKLTLHKLDAILDGDLDEIIDALTTFHQAEMLASQGDE